MAKKQYMTRASAERHLRSFFKRAAGDRVTREELLLAVGRDPAVDKNYKGWFTYMTTAMDEFGFFTKERGKNNKGMEIVTALILTDEGRRVLRRKSPVAQSSLPITPIGSSQADNNASSADVVTPEQALALVKKLAEQNPSFNVRLVFEPKETPMVH